ncbi:hypothetical protein [Haloferula sargassicola]|uniref:Lipoprotein n=1 Tax=Haloferula sargassicola TaxID=490096 RepID=A0ABP9UUF9_9BACT
MKTNALFILLAVLPLASCRDQEDEQRQKEINAAKAFDEQHDKAMKDATKINYPEPKPAGPIRQGMPTIKEESTDEESGS